MKFILLLIFSLSLYSQTSVFTVRMLFIRSDRPEVVAKINAFATALENQLNSYNWDFPHNDFERIETNININIEKIVSGNTFSGMITVSSGPASDQRYFVPLSKNIFFTERDLNFVIDYDNDPKLENNIPGSVETLVMFYSLLVMGENFDRLSYTDRPNFRLEGDFYYQQMYSMENILTGAGDRRDWDRRLELINTYRMERNTGLRRLNALMYNAVYFINTGKSPRAKLFIEPIKDIIGSELNITEDFFTRNFYALAEIFATGTEEDMAFLIGKDPSREAFYKNRAGRSGRTGQTR